MRKIYTLICAGIVSLTGLTVQAQSLTNMDDMIQQLATGGTASVTDIIDSIIAQPADTGPQVQAIEGPLVVDVVVPAVNQIDAETTLAGGQKAPRLKIDFAEFPLVSLKPANGVGNGANGNGANGNGTNNGRNGRNGASTDAVAQRIQNRLRLPLIELVVQDRVAIVSGTVETERQRTLVETMLRFEPGINAIRNEITVAP